MRGGGVEDEEGGRVWNKVRSLPMSLPQHQQRFDKIRFLTLSPADNILILIIALFYYNILFGIPSTLLE